MMDASTALRNSLLKTVYVSSAKAKFIEKVKEEDGGVELFVIEAGSTSSNSKKFEEYGSVCFELYYRTDLSLLC